MGEIRIGAHETYTYEILRTTNNEMQWVALEELLRRKQSYLLSPFFDQAANPMQNACLGLFLAYQRRGIKLFVKRNVSRGSSDSQRLALRRTLKLRIRTTIQRGRAIQ
jgi:hypothetical protein